MDEALIDRLAVSYRELSDEKLRALAYDIESLSSEETIALYAVAEERSVTLPEPPHSISAAAESDRPGLGWLILLMFGLGLAPVRYAVWSHIAFHSSEQSQPGLRDAALWQYYKGFAVFIGVAIAAAAIIAIRSILVGTKHRDKLVIIAMLWTIGPATFVLNCAAMFVLFGWTASKDWVLSNVGSMGASVAIATLWTLYLILSENCSRRYPRLT